MTLLISQREKKLLIVDVYVLTTGLSVSEAARAFM